MRAPKYPRASSSTPILKLSVEVCPRSFLPTPFPYPTWLKHRRSTRRPNHLATDKATYGPDADKFRPSRWMDKEHQIPAPYHFAFGAGGRMCTAVNFSNRVLYSLFTRLILSFRITESADTPANVHYIDYKRDSAESNAIASEFKVRMVPRDADVLKRCLEQARDRLADFNSGDDAEVLV